MKRFIEKALTILGKSLQILHLLRVQIFVALLVAFLIPTGVCLHNGTFIGLADAIHSRFLALITLSLFLLAWTLHITTRLVLIYGPARYGIPDITHPPDNPTPWRRFLHSPWFTLTIAAILPILTLYDLWRNTGDPSPLRKAIAIVLGFLFAIASLVIAATLHDWLEGQGGTTAEQIYPTIFIIHPGADRTPAGRFHLTTANPRAADPAMVGLFKDGRLRSGHQAALIFLAIFLIFYLVFFVIGLWPGLYPDMPAALFYAFLLVTWITWILAGLSFTLDRFHIPILTSLLIASLVLSACLPKDHEFKVDDNKQDALSPLSPAEVVNHWEDTHRDVVSGSDSPLVVVAIEGGGIEASAWGSLVLSKLETATQGKLHNSVVLVSSVSGGSTAAYYYLDQFNSGNGQPPFQDKNVLAKSEASSLNAVGWGFAYPDFFRTLPVLSWLVFAHSDRGYTLEQAWRNQSGSSASVRDWISDTSRGLRPAVIFNATGVETGQPVLFGTTRLTLSLPLFTGANDKQLEQQFLLTFPSTDLDVSTAARMSAAFPYISPEARPADSLLKTYKGPPPSPIQPTDESPQKAWDNLRLHVADGGLFDNSGVVSAVHWIYDLSQNPPQHPRPVVLIMITSPYHQESGASWSWQHQLIGPVETLLHVRTGSQHVRRNLEAQLLYDLSNSDPINSPITGQTSAGSSEPIAKPIAPVKVLRFCNATNPDLQTLSWHLTLQQRNALEDTWEKNYGDQRTFRQEVEALNYLLDPSQSPATPSNSCPEPEKSQPRKHFWNH